MASALPDGMKLLEGEDPSCDDVPAGTQRSLVYGKLRTTSQRPAHRIKDAHALATALMQWGWRIVSTHVEDDSPGQMWIVWLIVEKQSAGG